MDTYDRIAYLERARDRAEQEYRYWRAAGKYDGEYWAAARVQRIDEEIERERHRTD